MSVFDKEEETLTQIYTDNQDVVKATYFKYKDQFINYLVKKFACNRVEALDIYVDSFSTFYLNIRNAKLKAPLRSSLKTYIFSIGKYMWLNTKKKGGRTIELDDHLIGHVPDVSTRIEQREAAILVKRLLSRLNETCKEVLTLFFIQGFSAESVAHRLQLNNESAARKRKFDCLTKLRKLMNQL